VFLPLTRHGKKVVPSLFNIIFLTWQDLQEHSWHSYAALQEDCRIIEQLSTGGILQQPHAPEKKSSIGDRNAATCKK